MAEFCCNPARDRHELVVGGRRIEITPVAVDWGADDLRESWSGALAFCSFACLAGWANDKADQHDGRVLKEGT